ncbi:MAG: acetoacetate--CoA ligase [Ignavibacteria bacterium RBG_16_34_14]|nr:MAG: acetoacetate--CoA ligase [Ignavibacteria bacterium RBG_16_34_14]
MKHPIWSPSEERIKSSNMFKYLQYAESLINKKFDNYNELYQWSITDIEQFWESIWKFSKIKYSQKYKTVLTNPVMPGAKWFEGSKLNFAENLLRYRDNKIAIISSREQSPTIKISYSKLYELVAKCSSSLKEFGIKEGDRVAGFVSNTPESIIAMLAATSMGAVWSSCSPDFGFQSVLDRFGQIEPKILFVAEEYSYNGKIIDCREKIKKIVEKVQSIKKVVLIPRFNDFNRGEINRSKSRNYLYFNELIQNSSSSIEFKQLPFDHPVYIMYSSGTTGVPKCIVHGAGGTLLQHFKELSLHSNLTREETITYYTTCSWMMWNWLVSSLMVGATIFLYDGSPVYTSVNTLWKKIDEEKISVFGTSPKFIKISEDSKINPLKEFDLSSLRTILSTGSPLTKENFEWIYKNVKKDLQLSSISGGTDIISCFMLGNPMLAVYPGEIQCRGLGMKVEAFDEKGKSVIEKKGELVCTAPFPSMPIFFWNDPDGKKYKAAYFDDYPGIWKHGDFIKITKNGGVVVFGRSDATLNPGGVRIGTAEIYNIVESMEEIADSLVVGQRWGNDIRIILFVVMNINHTLNDDLIRRIQTNIRSSASSKHVPNKIIQVEDIPRTLNGKKVEVAVTRLIHDEKVENKDVLANPESLLQFKKILHLLSE